MRHTNSPRGNGFLVYLCVAIVSVSLLTFAQQNNVPNPNNTFYHQLVVQGTVFAYNFSGDGSKITDVAATNIVGVLVPAQLPTTIVYQGNTLTGALIGPVTGNVTGSLIGNSVTVGSLVVSNTAFIGALRVSNNITAMSITLTNFHTDVPNGIVPNISNGSTNWCLMCIDSINVFVATNPVDNNLLYGKITLTQSEVAP